MLDRGWTTLSSFADRGVLWWTLAGVLAVTGRPRAATRGILSLLAASATANLVAKRLFGGDRPLLEEVPVGRRLTRHPSTKAFPSGHSASAVAFATGVAVEDPRLGAAIVPLALGVGYSRLHVGAHWLSDVVGGLALGAAIGGLGALVVRPRTGRRGDGRGDGDDDGHGRDHGRQGSAARGRPIDVRAARPDEPTGDDRPLPAAPEGDGVFVVVNPSSGTSVVRADPLEVLRRRLPNAEFHVLDDEDPADVVRAALDRADPPRIVGVCGGDGTVATVADVARHAGVPLLVVPGGTFNHFARTAGASTVDLAIDAVQRGEGVRVDVAELRFGDQPPLTVMNTASVGVYPDFVAARERLQGRYGKWLAAVLAAAQVLRRSDPVRIDLDGRAIDVWTLFVGVGPNDPGVPAPLQRRRLDGGVLDVRILRAGSRTRAAASLAFGRRTSAVLRALRVLPDRVESVTAERLDVTVHPRQGQPPGFAHDGEVSFDRPAAADAASPGPGYTSTIRVVPTALDVYRPATRR